MKNIHILFCLILCSSCYDNSKNSVQPKEKIFVVGNNQVFELVLYGDLFVHAESLIKEAKSRHVHTQWNSELGECATGKHNFRLVYVGEQSSLNDVQRELEKYGKIPCGQWLAALKFRFPFADGNGPIGIPDSSWITSVFKGKECSYPGISGRNGDHWNVDFYWCAGKNRKNWRWLVMVD